MKYLPAIASLFFVPSAFAQNPDSHSVFSLSGECQELSVGGEDLRDICADEIMQVVYSDSTMDLAIWTDDPDGRFIVFAGSVERAAEGLAQEISLVIDGKDGSGDSNVEHPANGRCTLAGNPAEGSAQYRCEAMGEDGARYAFAFRTDGSAPENMLD